MYILIVYNQGTEAYCNYYADQLIELGYTVNLINIDDYDLNIEVTNTPAFLIVKNNKAGYPLIGKQDLNTVVMWATEAGVICN